MRELSAGREVTLVGASLKDIVIDVPRESIVFPGAHLELNVTLGDLQSVVLRAMVIESSRQDVLRRVRAILHWSDVREAKRFSSILWHLRIDHLTEPVTGRFVDAVDVCEPRDRILALLRALVGVGADIEVRGGDGRRGLLAGELRSEDDWPPFAFEVDVRTAYVDYSFRIGALAPNRPRTVRLTRVDIRSLPVVSAPHGVRARVRHPIFGEDLDLPVREISENVVIVTADPVESLLHPGLVLDDVRIEWRGGGCRVRARVEDVVPTEAPRQQAVVRLALWPTAPSSPGDDWERWCHEVARSTHPNTFVGRDVLAALWDVFAESGYFTLSDKNDELFRPLKTAFVESSEKLARAPHIGCQVSFCTPERVEATLAMVRTWEHTWLGYQLARRRDRRLSLSDGRLLYDLYRRGYEHSGRDPMVRWQVTYIQKNGSRISKLLHVEFPRRFGERLSCVMPFRAMEVRGVQPLEPDSDVGPATEDEREAVLAAISLARPAAYVDAHDFVPERFALPTLVPAWARAGLMRAREMLVVRDQGHLVAAAVLEAGEPGLHLYRLMDVVRVYPLGARGVERIPDLLRVAASWYLKRGLAAFVLFDEHGLDARELPGNVIDLGWADLSIMSHELVPELLEECLVAVASGSGRSPQ